MTERAYERVMAVALALLTAWAVWAMFRAIEVQLSMRPSAYDIRHIYTK
jgi:hypothetical protein